MSFIPQVLVRGQSNFDTILSRVLAFDPEVIMCSGWMDKGYLKICRSVGKDCVRVLTLDNKWSGSIKQRIASLLSPFTLKNSFDKAFVPGKEQKEYALKLGFTEAEISTGFYIADLPFYQRFYNELSMRDKASRPKRFLYLGRYVSIKGIFELWHAFNAFRIENQEWELWCVGTGKDFDQKVEAPGIRHFGFIQPEEILPILLETSVYILPSHFEPWGVSVHEMAISGFPMLLSNEIGAKEFFLEEGKNGWTFDPHDPKTLTQRMLQISKLSVDQLSILGVHSHELGLQHNHETWYNSFLHLVANK
ncbi:MAG: glycosyltransferase [Cryomorphaceae bacterium]